MTDIPRNHVGVIMDGAQQQEVVVPHPDPAKLPTIAAALDLPKTCGNPALVIRRG